MIQGPGDENISVAESTRHSWDEEENRLAREYDLRVRSMELEVLKLENRWNAWFRIPLTIIKLPVLIVFAIGYVVAVGRGKDVSQNYWNFMR
jgi:hypothetical protein